MQRTWMFAAVSLAAFAASAQEHRAPPPEAYAACSAKAQEAPCTVQLHERAMTGVCTADAEEELFCRPSRPPPRGPPPEALAACTGKKDGDACSAALPDGALRSGACRTGPDEKVACMPAGGPPRMTE